TVFVFRAVPLLSSAATCAGVTTSAFVHGSGEAEVSPRSAGRTSNKSAPDTARRRIKARSLPPGLSIDTSLPFASSDTRSHEAPQNSRPRLARRNLNSLTWQHAAGNT